MLQPPSLSRMDVRIRGIGTARPAHSISQDRAAQLAADTCHVSDHQRRVVANLFRMTTVQQRGSVLMSNANGNGSVSDAEDRLVGFYRGHADARPPTSARMTSFAQLAPPLAQEACTTALADAGIDAAAVTHLVTVTCTGFFSPGIDVMLIKRLGLNPGVKRAQIGFMGCHAALNALHTAVAMAKADPDAVVLVCCVELCSLHFQYAYDPQQLVSSALFADGAAAMVISSEAGADFRGWRVAESASMLIDDTEEDMTWRIGDHGFVMTLSARVPQIIERTVRPWLEPLLHRHGLSIADVPHWAIHPGGPRILTAVGAALGLDDAQLQPSREILRDHGNMSSPTVLFILDRLREVRPNAGAGAGACVMLSFGPGLIAEAALLV